MIGGPTGQSAADGGSGVMASGPRDREKGEGRGTDGDETGTVMPLPSIGSLVRLEGVNRSVKNQLKPKSNSPTALPLCEHGTTTPAGEISSQFKIFPTKFRSDTFLSFLQGSRSQIDS